LLLLVLLLPVTDVAKIADFIKLPLLGALSKHARLHAIDGYCPPLLQPPAQAAAHHIPC